MCFMTFFITSKKASAYIMAIACVHINGTIAHSAKRAAVNNIIVTAPNLDAFTREAADSDMP